MQFLALALGIVFDDDFERIEYAHASGCGLVELVADAEFQKRDIDIIGPAGDADLSPEAANCLGWAAAAAQSAQGVEAWVVPAVGVALFDELAVVAFGKRGIGDIAAGELDLPRGEDAELFNIPVVEWSVIDKLVRAH